MTTLADKYKAILILVPDAYEYVCISKDSSLNAYVLNHLISVYSTDLVLREEEYYNEYLLLAHLPCVDLYSYLMRKYIDNTTV